MPLLDQDEFNRLLSSRGEAVQVAIELGRDLARLREAAYVVVRRFGATRFPDGTIHCNGTHYAHELCPFLGEVDDGTYPAKGEESR